MWSEQVKCNTGRLIKASELLNGLKPTFSFLKLASSVIFADQAHCHFGSDVMGTQIHTLSHDCTRMFSRCHLGTS